MPTEPMRLKLILILIISFFSLLAFRSICFPDDTVLYNNITFTRIKGGISKANDEGRIKRNIDGKIVTVKRVKKTDYEKSIGNTKAVEDADKDGNTDWVYVRQDNMQVITAGSNK